MNRLAWTALFLLLCACASAGPAAGGDALLVLPGGFRQSTTVEDLRAMFGADNVVERDPADNDGRRGLVLFPRDPTRRAYVDFHDPERLEGISRIAVRDRDSRWRGKQGVRVGMGFAQLRASNGKPFHFGFDERMHGFVQDGWSPALDEDDATLGRLDVAEGEHMYFEVELGPRAGAGIPAGSYPEDPSAGSDDPRYSRLVELFEVTAIAASTSLDDEWE